MQDASSVNALAAANAAEEEDFTVVENYTLNGTMEEDTNGALTALEYRADTSSLEALVARALEIDAVLDTEYLEAGQEESQAALAAAQDVLANVDATQKEVEDAASALNQAMIDLRKIPDKSTLEALVQGLSAISGDGYTAQSYAALRASLNIAMQVLEDPNAT